MRRPDRPFGHVAETISAIHHDLRLGTRMLLRSPGFALAAVATLALGIGANTAVFSIVNSLILRPLSYENADRLVTILERHEGSGSANLPWANFLDLESQTHSFAGLVTYGAATQTVLVGGAALRVKAGRFSSGLFSVFPTRPVIGRLPTADETRKGANPVAVVSYAFWRDHLGAPASLDGIHIKLGTDYTVVGVLPSGFEFPDGNQIWTPAELFDQSMSRTSHDLSVVGLLRPDVSIADATRDLDAILARIKPLYSPDFDAAGVDMTPLQVAMTASVRAPLYLLLAASAVLLLGACVNLASAMLARGTARLGEFALRSALGASRMRIVRQLLTESILLALIGCVAGLALAGVFLKVLPLFAPQSLHVERVHLDARVLAFAAVVATATAVLFGLFPALRLSAGDSSPTLRDGSRGTAGAGRMRAWSVLVSAEVALAVVLLAGSALLIRSFARVMEAKLGFEPTNVYTVDVNLPAVHYGDTAVAVGVFHERVLDRLRRASGVDAVGFANVLPLEGNFPNGGMQVEGKPLDPRGPFTGYAVYRVVGGDFFRAMGIPVLAGRALRPGDEAAAERPIVVNEEFARREWPGQDPIGKRARVAGMDNSHGRTEEWSTVIGVVGNVRGSTVTGPYSETYYFDHRTRPASRSRAVTYVIKSHLPATALAPMVRREIAAVDREVTVDVKTMNDLIDRSVVDRRFTMVLLGAFASIALLLSIVGIYAVASYSVAQRTREIGVRIALGATASNVQRLILTSTMTAVIPGLLAGAIVALGTAQTMRSMLFGVSPFDVGALAAAVGLLGAAAVASSMVPALRATGVDPIIAMRAN